MESGEEICQKVRRLDLQTFIWPELGYHRGRSETWPLRRENQYSDNRRSSSASTGHPDSVTGNYGCRVVVVRKGIYEITYLCTAKKADTFVFFSSKQQCIPIVLHIDWLLDINPAYKVQSVVRYHFESYISCHIFLELSASTWNLNKVSQRMEILSDCTPALRKLEASQGRSFLVLSTR